RRVLFPALPGFELRKAPCQHPWAKPGTLAGPPQQFRPHLDTHQRGLPGSRQLVIGQMMRRMVPLVISGPQGILAPSVGTADQATESSLNDFSQATFRADLETKGNGLTDVFQSLVFGRPLTDATRNRRALSYPNSVFISIECHMKTHEASRLRHDSIPEVRQNAGTGNLRRGFVPKRRLTGG